MTGNIIKETISMHNRYLVEAKNLSPKIKGALMICDIEGEGIITSGLGTTTSAKTPEEMKDDAVCMVCQKHCCAEQPMTDTCCEACPLYQFIRYQEGA